MTAHTFLLRIFGYVRLRNILDTPLIVPVDLREDGLLQPGTTLTVSEHTAKYLLQTAGYAGRLERVQ